MFLNHVCQIFMTICLCNFKTSNIFYLQLTPEVESEMWPLLLFRRYPPLIVTSRVSKKSSSSLGNIVTCHTCHNNVSCHVTNSSFKYSNYLTPVCDTVLCIGSVVLSDWLVLMFKSWTLLYTCTGGTWQCHASHSSEG